MNQHIWQRAASFAARAHEGQKRKLDACGKAMPYIAHPLRVAMTISAVFGFDDEDILAAALLHDTIEDTPVDYDELAKEFGATIASFVSHMSKDMRLPGKQREALYDARLAEGPWQARLIKLADVYDNLSDAMQERPKSIPDYLKKGARALALTESDSSLVDARKKLQELLDAARAAHDRWKEQPGDAGTREVRNTQQSRVS